MEYEEMEKLSLEESKKQTKERKQHGLNMIRPFTFEEKKMLWDGLREDKNENTTNWGLKKTRWRPYRKT